MNSKALLAIAAAAFAINASAGELSPAGMIATRASDAARNQCLWPQLPA